VTETTSRQEIKEKLTEALAQMITTEVVVLEAEQAEEMGPGTELGPEVVQDPDLVVVLEAEAVAELVIL
jgi:hypothetical protein